MWPRMKRMPCLLVDSPAQWRVLVSPVRAEIVEALRMLGPCSIADIAGTLDVFCLWQTTGHQGQEISAFRIGGQRQQSACNRLTV